MTRGRAAILGVAVVIAIVLGLWWRTSGGGKPAKPDGEAAKGDVAARDEGASGPRRSVGGDHRVALSGEVLVDGKVVDASGAGVSGVDVVFGRKIDETVTSGHDGAFQISLPAGGYEVRALGERLYAAPRTVEVGAAGAPVVIEVTELAVGRGWVIDAAGKPVAGATVATGIGRKNQAAVDKDGVLPSVTTDANGVFEIDLLPGYDRLTADHPRAGHGHIKVEDVQPGDREEDLRIQLAPYAALTGVVRSPDGVGMAGAEVIVTIRATAFRRAITATTGEGGAFTIGDAVPGDLTIDAHLDGFAAAEPQHLALAAGDTPAALTLTLTVPVTMTGRVIDADGEPVFDAKVKVQRDGSDITFHAARTDVDGRFEVTGLTPGPQTVTVEVDRRGRLTLKIEAIPDAPLELRLGA